MKLEEAIQQTKFISEHQKVHLNILFSASWLSQRSIAILKPYGLTWQQFNVLRILRGRHPEPATVKLLTERMIDKMSNASRLVDKLLAKGLVVRVTSKEDRRRVDVSITDSGLKLLEEASAELENEMRFEKGYLSCAEAEELNRLLDKMRTLQEEAE
ncbi:MAG: MarR family winged helix-turn-helix transcriptional regulator [Lewinella sp.]|jgi:DNA-binding MarR family transcriptional regulator|uniref:MarR family winged helix-turn-helix transcriptional regulator n=1 Tax=Lewinella sp. TaxID=2004506 RepID=UPI003D6A4B09